ncbi:unnamed protein product [Auanema sp. JU1783]|nr:unnamed protein product [Auanema sp. JU1783]
MNLKDGGEEARHTCLKKLPYEYPKVMYSSRGMDLSFQDTGVIMIASYTLLYTSIREQAKSSQSTQFLANQRRITTGILYFMIVETVGFGCPFLVLCLCAFLNVGNTVVSQLAFMTMCIYPIFGPYYVLMSNTDYRNRVRGILKKAQELGTSHLSS